MIYVIQVNNVLEALLPMVILRSTASRLCYVIVMQEYCLCHWMSACLYASQAIRRCSR